MAVSNCTLPEMTIEDKKTFSRAVSNVPDFHEEPYMPCELQVKRWMLCYIAPIYAAGNLAEMLLRVGRLDMKYSMRFLTIKLKQIAAESEAE